MLGLVGILGWAVLGAGGCQPPAPKPPVVEVPGTGGAAGVCRYTVSKSARSRSIPDSRIVNGEPSDAGAFPFAVALETRGGRQFCGGSVITPTTVVTAAHCQVLAGERVVVGTNDLREGGRHIEIVEVRNHPDWRGTPSTADVAVLHLAELVGVEPIPIVLPDAERSWAVGVAVGWGALEYGGPTTPVQQFVELPPVDHAWCAFLYGGTVDDTMFCAGGAGVDTCSGDSGGPFVVQTGDGWALLGATSWGTGCAGLPGVYADLSVLRDWIEVCSWP